MLRSLWLILMVTGLTLFGCDSPQPSKSKSTHAAQKPAKVEQTMVEESKAVTQTTPSTPAVKEGVTSKLDQAAKMTETTFEKTGKASSAVVEKSAKVAERIVTTVEEKAVETVAAAKSVAIEVAPAAKKENILKEITLEASYGNVTFPHGMHAESYECSICHGNATPSAFGITKEVAHKLCKGCHKGEGAGPTGCSGCHVK